MARLLVRLIEPSGGEIEVDARPVTRLRGPAAHEFRRKVQMVFQDPYRSLNPRRTVGAAIAEGPLNFGATRADAWQRAAELMDLVKLSPGRSTGTHTSFPAANASASALRARSRSIRRS